jgi:hypothetical protein
MVSLRLAVPMVLAAAVVAACFTYLVAPQAPVEADYRPPPRASSSSVQGASVPMRIARPVDDDEKAVAAFQRAADAILKRTANLQAAAPEQLPISGKVPLPRRRPIPRP